ncbi:SCO7613 C-terminal domain-containing membrane protein [Agromyces sp. Marseille-P2726]|uniref:SCO7613 C-terminal domain-containing membrane protein n=1 Tax=Agromyces sp. Marseille-P2726 TaxID=2709132 RepID=UPI00156D97B0|nr:hypothetical protein [Agromyces sp. Marseille-P2726]
MTDRSRALAPGLRRWPSDPAQFVDTTRCPACFSMLRSPRCTECGLDLRAPEAARLFQVSARVYEGELERQSLIDRMWRAQDAAARPAPRPEPIPVPVPVPVAAAALAPVATTSAPPTATFDPPIAAPDAAAPRRSGVQVLLLTLGVVLISVTAIVFLFVAYLVASQEVRSIIIAGASVLVLALAWLLRARRLPGTAEGVASVAVVLGLLDVWIVRANDLFGTAALGVSVYTGIAFAVVAMVLAATRAVSGIRIVGFAAAALTPIAAFLLGFAIDPGTATGAWLGGLVALLAGVGVGAGLRAGLPERSILISAGFAGGVAALAGAGWALHSVPWGVLWAFLGVAASLVVVIVVLRLRGSPAERGFGIAAAIGVGLAAALGLAIGVAVELERSIAIWSAPALAAVVACVCAALVRVGGRTAQEARASLIAAAAVALAAAAPGALVAFAGIGGWLLAAIPPWGGDTANVIVVDQPDIVPGVALVPFMVAGGAFVVALLLGQLRRAATVPIGAAVAGGVVLATLAPDAALAAVGYGAVGAVGLGVAAVAQRHRVPGLVPTLALLGMSSAALGAWTAYASVPAWPWVTALVIVTAVAGRVVAGRVWSDSVAPAAGATHVVIASLLGAIAVVSIPSWSDAAGSPLTSPWDSPWMWLGVVGAAMSAAALASPRLTAADRTSIAVPWLGAATTGAFAVAFDGGVDPGWIPAALVAVVSIAALRFTTVRPVCVLLAVVGPLLLAVALGRLLVDIPGGAPAGIGVAAGVLLSAGLAHIVLPRRDTATKVAWNAALGVAGLGALASVTAAGDQQWLLLLVLAPVPVLVAALDGDPIGGEAQSRLLSWLSIPPAVGAVWSWLAGDGVDDIEAYTLPLAAFLLAAGALIAWRRDAHSSYAAGRTTLVATAAAIAVLPSVASSADSELRTLILVSAGAVVALAAAFLPETARAIPLRLIAALTGWTAVTGTAVVRGSAVALGESSDLVVEFWPLLALVTGAMVAVGWARTSSRPAWIAEALLAASVIAFSVPTMLAIIDGNQATTRTVVLFPLLAILHVAAVATTARPVGGPMLSWASLALLVLGGTAVLGVARVDPFDLVTASIAAALLGAGVFRMRRSPALGSWPALGPGLAVLLIPALIADFTDPELWRLIALGVVAAAAVVVGALRRLQAPLILGGGVLLVHAVAQLWPWITWLYEAVWWWLWLGIAGVVLVALAATYERQLRLARGVVQTVAELR